MDPQQTADQKVKKVGLALSGGLAMGLAHVGVLEMLKEHQIPIDCISGTSAGAIIAALYAFRVPISQIIEEAEKLHWSKVFSFPRSRMGLSGNKIVGELFTRILGDVKIEDANIPLFINTVDIQTGQLIVQSRGGLEDAVLASSAIPGVFSPVEIEGKMLVDGGLMENLPILALKNFGANIIIGVDLSFHRKIKEPKHLADVMLNSYDILVSQQINYFQNKADILIRPHLESFSITDFDKASEFIEAGRQAVLEKINELDVIKSPKPSKETEKKSAWKSFLGLFK
jgi:NTE family protein